jgi:ATP-dependent Clp protease ATP-binding subunit ClpA
VRRRRGIREDQVRGDGRARGHFRPEFINRIDEIIVFHALGKEEIRHIVGLQLIVWPATPLARA